MRRLKAFIKFAMLFCFLLYLTCYLRFIGQVFLELAVLISALSITLDVYTKPITIYRKELKIFWITTILNLAIVSVFFETVLNNDILQFPFITFFPNVCALYFLRILNKLIRYEEAVKPNTYEP
ncbi:hypothetical protein [Flavobacterium pedocola]